MTGGRMMGQGTRRRIVIMGAAGRDFHNFNTVYRDDPSVEVVAFTAAQIPGISGRMYPPSLAGSLYPVGIPIVPETELEVLCREKGVAQVVFAYSDVTHAAVMHLASRALASGADFLLLGPDATMLRARIPVAAVSAVRTGCGKSQTARWLSRRLARRGLRVAVLRHPMPYGDLERQRLQRFAALPDLDVAACSIEEREEYEPHIAAGNVVYAGVDYGEILTAAESEADIIVWDGGNNDFPFLRPDLNIVVADALRPAQMDTHHPGEAVLRMADAVVLNKVRAASDGDVASAVAAARAVNSSAPIIKAESPVNLDDPLAVAGKSVLVVEDGPTLTHGGMAYGAGYVAAVGCPGVRLVDPRGSAAPSIRAVFDAWPHIGNVLPAMGYGEEQQKALRETIVGSGADVIVAATPIDLAKLLRLDMPVVRARYEFEDGADPSLGDIVDRFFAGVKGKM